METCSLVLRLTVSDIYLADVSFIKKGVEALLKNNDFKAKSTLATVINTVEDFKSQARESKDHGTEKPDNVEP